MHDKPEGVKEHTSESQPTEAVSRKGPCRQLPCSRVTHICYSGKGHQVEGNVRVRKTEARAGTMAQCLKLLTALAEDTDLVSSTHILAYNCLQFQEV